MTVLVDTTIFGDPIPKGRPREDSRNRRTYTPARTQNAQDAMAWALLAGRLVSEPVAGPAEIKMVLRLRCATRRRTDGDNLIKLVMDAGNGIIYDDDSQITKWDVELERGSKNAGTDIRFETR